MGTAGDVAGADRAAEFRAPPFVGACVHGSFPLGGRWCAYVERGEGERQVSQLLADFGRLGGARARERPDAVADVQRLRRRAHQVLHPVRLRVCVLLHRQRDVRHRRGRAQRRHRASSPSPRGASECRTGNGLPSRQRVRGSGGGRTRAKGDVDGSDRMRSELGSVRVSLPSLLRHRHRHRRRHRHRHHVLIVQAARSGAS